MKKMKLLAVLSMLMMLCAHAYAYDVALNDIKLDYDNGVIEVSGDIGYGNSGSRVAVSIAGEDGRIVYSDQTTSTAYGKFNMNVKMTAQYQTGEYTVSAFGSDTDAAAVKTFEFDSSRDNYYVSNLRIEKNGGKTENAYTGEELEAKFDFFSAFGYGIGETEYLWQVSGAADGVFHDLASKTALCSLTSADVKKLFSDYKDEFSDKKIYVKVTVRAKTTVSEDFSQSVASENVVEIITLPTAERVSAKRDGKKLTGSYFYSDLQDKAEKGSKFEWLEQSGSSYKVVSEGLTFVLPSSNSGKNYKFRVTPKSDDGTIGAAVESETLYVGADNPGGGGSSSSGGSVSAGRPAPVTTPEPVVTPAPDEGFSDVPDGHWAKDAIDRLVEKKIVSGMGDGRFAPSREVTRAEFAAMMLGCIGAEKAAYDGRFSDVPADAWYAPVVQSVSELGLLNGAEGLFRPTDNITREEMAKVLSGVCKAYVPDAQGDTAAEFNDFDTISAWAAQDVELCAGLGLISGMPDGSFAPKECVTRAQAAVVSDKICAMIAAQKGEV